MASDDIGSLNRAEILGAFAACTALTTIDMPSLITIGKKAFYCCTSITSVNFPALETIYLGAFGRCSGLTSLHFPSTKVIGKSDQFIM